MSRKLTPSVHPGLVNPQVSARPTGVKPSISPQPPAFKTHIPEPRWQQIVSIIVAIVGACVWLFLVFYHK